MVKGDVIRMKELANELSKNRGIHFTKRYLNIDFVTVPSVALIPSVRSVGVQRPAMRERYNRAFAPVLVIDFGALLGGDCA